MTISVIIPVYNAEKLLEKAVLSALQFDEVKEVLLIEDASPDSSLEVCQRLVKEHARVKLYQHADQGNHGAGATRNLGLEKASEDYIAFLDADDYYLPNRFDAERELFNNPKIEGVFGAIGTEFLSEKGKEEFQNKFKNISITTVKHKAEGDDVFYGLLGLNQSFGTFFHLNTLTVKSKCIKENNLRFNEKLRVHQDSDFIIKLSYTCHLSTGEIKQPVAIRGVHDDNRITKIKTYSPEYNKRQNLLWNSLYEWFKDKSIKVDYKEHLYLKKKSFEIATLNGFSKWKELLKTVLKNKNILKTRYRFTYLNK